MLINENQLDEWVRGNSRHAQEVIVDLVFRLVATSSPAPKDRRFPQGDSIGQQGPDGILEVEFAFDPFIPVGLSYWEIGTGVDAGAKATSDYKDSTNTIPAAVRAVSTFVFVTPLSGRRGWPGTWKEDAQLAWLEDRRNRKDWRDVRVIDGTKLIDWVHIFLPIEIWLAQKLLRLPSPQMDTPEHHWNIIRSIGEPPQLNPKLFLANREIASKRLADVFENKFAQLKLETRFPDQVPDFVSAYLASLSDDLRSDVSGRLIIVSGIDAWNTIVGYSEKHFLIADPQIDLNGDSGTALIQRAQRAGHAVIFGGPKGGIPDPTSILLGAPTASSLRDALVEAGYNSERARILVQRSGADLQSLLRCLQNLSLLPEWADQSAAADLAIAVFIGSWVDDSSADRGIAEQVSGKAYGEWIERIRDVANRPNTPLTQFEGKWSFSVRYEGWYALGPRIYDDHLAKFLKSASSVLKEIDPQFDLRPDQRYAAQIHGKVLTHSNALRNGIAEGLALLGSHPKALTSSSLGRPELTAALAIRDILGSADWRTWASLNHLLPLLAEAAPIDFMDAVDKAIAAPEQPFIELFAQEGKGLFGGTHISGLLWALETLAWDSKYLTRVVILLGELAAIDPGGQWSNRPANSLTSIFLPWYPQTTATLSQREAAIRTLLREIPNTGWTLLLTLLPRAHTVSSGTRKPAWRDFIPQDWNDGVLATEYMQQIETYLDIALAVAIADVRKFSELVEEIDDLPQPLQERLIAKFESLDLEHLPDDTRYLIWKSMTSLIARHRKFSDANWAMNEATVERLSEAADRFAPKDPRLVHERLFRENDFDLFEDRDNYAEQMAKVDELRKRAVQEIALISVLAVVDFAKSVQSPWRVGLAFGQIGDNTADSLILPQILGAQDQKQTQFVGGFVWGRFQAQSWPWVDTLPINDWSPPQQAELLTYLPFDNETWKRVSNVLGDNECHYWQKAAVNPYATSSNMEKAVDNLLQFGRPMAAVRCLYGDLHAKRPLDVERVVRALLAAINTKEAAHSLDAYEINKLIKALQDNPKVDPTEIAKVEWAYLPILDEHRKAGPVRLSMRLATDPDFFCEIIRLVFRSANSTDPKPSEDERGVATNAYRLLHEWKIPPGTTSDGGFDGDKFGTWIKSVKLECSASGHLAPALNMIGQVLTHAPKDSDGLWIHRAVAMALNARDAESMRNGFRTALYNARGAHWVDPTGNPERELSLQYTTKADLIEQTGFHRLAETLRELANVYQTEAERIVARSSEEHLD